MTIVKRKLSKRIERVPLPPFFDIYNERDVYDICITLTAYGNESWSRIGTLAIFERGDDEELRTQIGVIVDD